MVGGFYSDTDRDYGQNLPVPGFEAASGIPDRSGLAAPRDVLFYSDLHYDSDPVRGLRRGHLGDHRQLDLTGGLRYYDFEEDRTQIFDGIFARHNDSALSPSRLDGADGFAPRVIASYKATDNTRFNAQVSKGFRLGGINDPLNVPLCTPADLVTFGGRENWEDETLWNYEVGAKSPIMGGRGTFNAVASSTSDIEDLQATVTAGSCSSRVIFNVPSSRSRGVEVEFESAPNDNFDFSISGSFNRLRAALDADRSGRRSSPASRKATACPPSPSSRWRPRRPTSSRWRAGSATSPARTSTSARATRRSATRPRASAP